MAGPPSTSTASQMHLLSLPSSLVTKVPGIACSGVSRQQTAAKPFWAYRLSLWSISSASQIFWLRPQHHLQTATFTACGDFAHSIVF